MSKPQGRHVIVPDTHGDARFVVVPSIRGGKSWDIALYVDGGYSSRVDADEMAAYFNTRVHRVNYPFEKEN